MESAGRRALMESARVEFAERGPGGVSLRAIAARSGCSHPLVARHFGNKKGLELAVVEQLADSVEHIVDCVGGEPAERFATLTHQLRADPVAVPLLVRCVLGDLDDRALLPALSTLATGLAGTLRHGWRWAG